MNKIECLIQSLMCDYMLDTSQNGYYNDYHKQGRDANMRVIEGSDDIRIMASKLSDENKKYVVAVAQALLFTQEGLKSEQRQSDNKVCLMAREQ